MVKKISFYVFFIIFTFIFSFSLFSQSPQNTLTITTYYPSPFGVYKELRVKRMAIGDNYYKSSDYCWEGICSTHISSNTGLIVEGNVGIGTTDPMGKLDVNGRDIVLRGGARKWIIHNSGGFTLAPRNNADTGWLWNGGLRIDSNTLNVGIGTINPQAKLHVNGRIKAQDPIDDDDVATKAYVDAQVGGKKIHWDECQVKSDCVYLSGSKTLSCDSGYVLVDHSCAMEKSDSGECCLTGVNQLFIENRNVSSGKTCGSIKCCKYY